MPSSQNYASRPNPWGGYSPQAARQPQPTFEDRLEQLLTEGLAQHQAGKLSAARRCYEQALAMSPGQADALNLLGVVAAQESRGDDAIELLTRASAARPKDGDILNNLGRFLLEASRFEDAKDPLERAVALQPDDVNSKYNLAGVLRHLGEPERALTLWREVLAADPNLRSARVGVIELLSEKGEFDEAEKMARELVAAHPDVSPAYLCLARVRRFDRDDGTLEMIERRIEMTPSERAIDETFLRYAAGKVCDDLGQYGRAFRHFEIANRISHGGYDEVGIQAKRRAQAQVFTRGFFRAREGWGFPSDVPVFIVGMPRSGTSLVEQMLAAHPEVFGAGEITAFERMARLSADMTTGEEPYPQSTPDLNRFGAEVVGRRYLSALTARVDRPARRITDKLPHNFEHLGMVALALPKAKVIHCRRDPLDTCVSCWTTSFADAHAYNRSFADLGRYYRGYVELMDHWRAVLPIQILDVDYEALVAEPEAEARRMVEFLELDWSAEVLDFHKDGRAGRSPSLWQVRQPLYGKAVGRWRNYEAQIDPLKEALGDLAAD